MSPAILEASAIVSTSTGVPRNLTALHEKLASIRYLIILTARWEGSDNIGPDRRKLMGRDLERLRREYLGLIDEIAMNFGVREAMAAQEEVEHEVVVPRGINPPATQEEEDDFSV